jgi:hypothetical protein
MTQVYEFTAALFRWEGNAAWHFVALPEDVTDEIDERHGHCAAGFGSLPVEVTVGATTWRTSVFPDSRRKTFVLPVKKAVRAKEKLEDGVVAAYTLTVRAG